MSGKETTKSTTTKKTRSSGSSSKAAKKTAATKDTTTVEKTAAVEEKTPTKTVEKTPVKAKEKVPEPTPVKTEPVKETPKSAQDAKKPTDETKPVKPVEKTQSEEKKSFPTDTTVKESKEEKTHPLVKEMADISKSISAKKKTSAEAHMALNFISGMNIVLSNEDEDITVRIKIANNVLDHLANIKKLMAQAGTVIQIWAGDRESLDAYTAVLAMAAAKQNGKLKDMPKTGIKNQFYGKFIGMGYVMAECS